jgi:hypothetical protein
LAFDYDPNRTWGVKGRPKVEDMKKGRIIKSEGNRKE